MPEIPAFVDTNVLIYAASTDQSEADICREFARPKNSWKFEVMKADPILEEIWRIKDELSREMAADPAAYFARLDEITKAQEKAGRKIIRSAEELRQLVAEKERQRAGESAMVFNDKLPRKKQ